jgi:hypothetical protein
MAGCGYLVAYPEAEIAGLLKCSYRRVSAVSGLFGVHRETDWGGQKLNATARSSPWSSRGVKPIR